jgi:hypothetical protein
MIQAIVHTEPLQALLEKLTALLPGSTGYNSMMRVAAVKALQSVKQRIHAGGLAADGSDIGTYATKPIYISTVTGTGKGFAQPMGKSGKQAFTGGKKKGQPHTSQYFAGGYNQFKTAIGLNEIGKVNLTLTGELCNQLTVLPNTTGTGYALGWPNEQLQQRALALQAKYGKPIWALTQQERSETLNVLTCECVNVLK